MTISTTVPQVWSKNTTTKVSEATTTWDAIAMAKPVIEKEWYEVSYEVMDGMLYVNRLQESNGAMERIDFALGHKHKVIRSNSGKILYWSDNVYYTDRNGHVHQIQLPETFDLNLWAYYVLENVFEKTNMFVIYKSPQHHEDKWICFIFDIQTHTAVSLLASKDFHNAIISNVNNIHFFCKSIVKGYIVVELGHVIQKFIFKNIVAKEKNHFEAIIGDMQQLDMWSVSITKQWVLLHVPYDSQSHMQWLSWEFSYRVKEGLIHVTDTEKEVSYVCQIPENHLIKEVHLDAQWNLFGLARSWYDNILSLVYASINSWYEDIMTVVVGYQKILSLTIMQTKEDTNLVFVWKEENKPRELVIFSFASGKNLSYTYPLKASDLNGDLYIWYTKDEYKLTVISKSDNPTVVSCKSFALHPDAPKVQYSFQQKQKKEKESEWYHKEVLEKGLPSYAVLKKENEDLKEFLETIKYFFNSFTVQSKKTLLWDLKEHIHFDTDQAISLYKSITDHPVYKKED